MGIQIFGSRKCAVSRKAERFFKERDVPYQFVDLADTGISPGELEALRRAAGTDGLLDTDGARYKKRGLAYMDIDPVEEILADPRLLRTPAVRNGADAVLGDQAEGWARMAAAFKDAHKPG